MKTATLLDDSAFATVGPALLSSLARLVFAGVLLAYFWNSGLTKIGAGPFTPSDGAYIQVFPRLVETFGYDFSLFTAYHTAVILLGTAAEFVLPLLIMIGLFTRPAALGMIVFIAVQTLTDIVGHGIGGADLGGWFDSAPGSLICDQRALWVVVLAALLTGGAGPLSLDRFLSRNSIG